MDTYILIIRARMHTLFGHVSDFCVISNVAKHMRFDSDVVLIVELFDRHTHFLDKIFHALEFARRIG